MTRLQKTPQKRGSATLACLVPFGGPARFYAVCAACAFALSLAYLQSSNITAFYLDRQDRWLLLLAALLLCLCAVRSVAVTALPLIRPATLLVFSVGLVAVLLAGHFLVLDGYDRSRDEQMASFDAIVYGSGRLVAHLPVFWRDHSDALNTSFMYPADQRAAWLSNYLPFNALFRAVFAKVATPALTGPIMTALGGVALWGCLRRLWPEDAQSVTVGCLLYIGSAQVLLNGMTSYAMPGHLALNLCWLWLYLRDTRLCDATAVVVGFTAMGLHQPLMHPMFAAPLLFLLVLDRRWDRVVVFLVGYAAAGAFWLWWPGMIWHLAQADPAALPPEGVDYATRLLQVIKQGDPRGLPNMVANLLRFAAWQHLLLVPLLLVGAHAARSDRLAAALAGGIIVTVFAMAVLLPYQGHGFGYRYLHGLIGNAIILAIFGWRKLSLDQNATGLPGFLITATLANLAILLPVQLWMAHAFYSASANASHRVDRIGADFVVIGAADARDAYDLVYNQPDLDNRPIRLLKETLTVAAVKDICGNKPTVALADDAMLQSLTDFYRTKPAATISSRKIEHYFTDSGCTVIRSVG